MTTPAVTGIVGQEVGSPCQISTGTQPDNMEVQWKKITQVAIEPAYEYRAETGQDVPAQKYQGQTELLKDGFTSGNVSLKLKNVQAADRGMYSCIVKSNEWSADAATELKIAEFKNGETLKEKEKKTVRFSSPETPEKSTEFEKGETLKEKEKKRERRRRSFPPEIFENNTEKMGLASLALRIIETIIIGIVFTTYRSRRLISAEEGRYGPRVDESQSQGKLQKEKDELQAELNELQAELNELQAELRRLQKEKEELQGERNWRRTHKYADNITLDAGTAHHNLSISEDRKNFTHEPQPQKVQPTPERFDSTVCVLGSEGFSSGKHYWEVDVVSSSDWDLGVARKSIQRKGKLSLSPKEGFWALGLSGRDYWAKTDPWTRVLVQKKPKKIGVYLSYQDRQVTFFSVADMSVLFTFNNCSFSGAVYPFFKNSNKESTMRICSIREDE